MPLDLPPKPDLWLPPKPAIIRAWKRDAAKATFPMPTFMPSFLSKELSYLGESSSTASASTYNYASEDFGAAAESRRIHVAAFNGGTAATLSSVTIGGIAATINVQNGVSQARVGIATAAVPTGTSGTISVVWSTTLARSSIMVWRSVGLISSTPLDTDSSTAEPASLTLTTLSGGFAIAAAVNNEGATVTWANITEDFDGSVEACFYTGAHIRTLASSLAITATYSGDVTSSGMAAASW